MMREEKEKAGTRQNKEGDSTAVLVNAWPRARRRGGKRRRRLEDEEEEEEEAPEPSEAGNAQESTGNNVRNAKFEDESVPAAFSEKEAVRVRRRCSAKLLAKVGTMFEERPVWLLGAIEHNLPSTLDSYTIQQLLRTVAYKWSGGPWNGTYTRLGWDPRQNGSESKGLQVFKFVDPSYSKTDKAADDGYDGSFRRPPTRRTTHYQLCDIKDDMVSEYVAMAEPESVCAKEIGFLSEDTLFAVRMRLELKSKDMRDRADKRVAAERAAKRAERKSTVSGKRLSHGTRGGPIKKGRVSK